MAKLTIVFGLMLMLLGAGAYFGSGRASVTALIPAFFGVVIAACGAVAMGPRWQRPALIVAVIVGALGFIGSLSRIVPGVVSGSPFQLNLATGTQLAMAVITAAFVAFTARPLLSKRRQPRESTIGGP